MFLDLFCLIILIKIYVSISISAGVAVYEYHGTHTDKKVGIVTDVSDSECTVVWNDGEINSYFFVRDEKGEYLPRNNDAKYKYQVEDREVYYPNCY